MHPTFRNPDRTITDGSTGFELTTAGWEMFTPTADVHLKSSSEPLQLELPRSASGVDGNVALSHQQQQRCGRYRAVLPAGDSRAASPPARGRRAGHGTHGVRLRSPTSLGSCPLGQWG
ncbi:pYEATS domain-containing protein [Streptomyces sp. NPDC057694]|uniref:pYEATS domain-containing protein n=1 Tax=Streptomyces sp. NPDC057694 TaxID=3346216 RepID=UPI0036C6CCB7